MKDNNTYRTKTDEDMINNKLNELQKMKEKVTDEEWYKEMFKLGIKYKRF